MYYLEKCAYKNCTRHGSVALKEHDTYCNIHKNNGKKDEEEENNED